MRYNVWINNENDEAFSEEGNKSGLINRLLEAYYRGYEPRNAPHKETELKTIMSDVLKPNCKACGAPLDRMGRCQDKTCKRFLK